jgi:hypothetical protein
MSTSHDDLGFRQHEPPYELIRDGLRRGKVIPFLGAGASLLGRPRDITWRSPQSEFLPMSVELAEYLDRRSGFPPGEQAELTRVAQYFDGVAGRGGLDDELHEIFAKTYLPGPLHYYLARLGPLLIVTTNYDDLLERAFNDAGRPYHLIAYQTGDPTFLVWRYGQGEPSALVANEIDLQVGEHTIIYKMHGNADRVHPERDSFLITEDDTVEFLARMAARTAIPAIFGEPFRRSHFLFLGYGLRDWNLRVILHRIWQDYPRRRYASWAIQEHAQPLEREFWSRRSLTIYEMSIIDLLGRLEITRSGDPRELPK